MSSNIALRASDHTAMPDLAEAASAAEQFIRALGVSLDAESMRDTPRRMTRAYVELFTPRPFDLTTFPNDECYEELVLARSIPGPVGLRASFASVRGHCPCRVPTR
jgi:GTP cyclohydrolase IA